MLKCALSLNYCATSQSAKIVLIYPDHSKSEQNSVPTRPDQFSDPHWELYLRQSDITDLKSTKSNHPASEYYQENCITLSKSRIVSLCLTGLPKLYHSTKSGTLKFEIVSTSNKSKNRQKIGRQKAPNQRRRISHSEIYIELSKHLP